MLKPRRPDHPTRPSGAHPGLARVKNKEANEVITGLYVARFGDEMWIAGVTLPCDPTPGRNGPDRGLPETGRLVVVPKEEVRAYVIGTPTTLGKAYTATHAAMNVDIRTIHGQASPKTPPSTGHSRS